MLITLGVLVIGVALAAILSTINPGETSSSQALRGPGPQVKKGNGRACDLVAAPTGSDNASGSVAHPLQSVQELVNSLGPDETGCLQSGTYTDPSDNEVKISRPQITLQSFPGETPTVLGRLWVSADGVTVQDLNLDGRNPDSLPSPTVTAADVTFRNDDVTNGHTAICFSLGSQVYGVARSTLIENSRIHDCGRLPPTNRDHGIYVADAVGPVIRDNWIYANADRGIQLYPSSQRAVVTGNVIDRNGEGIIFSGSGTETSGHNLVRGNVIANSNVRWNVESGSAGPTARGNVVRDNCVFASNPDSYYDSNGGIQQPAQDFRARGNLVADPRYENAGGADYRLQSDSPCLRVFTGSSPGGG